MTTKKKPKKLHNLEKDECGAYFYNLQEACNHLRCAYSDLLGYYAYQGKSGMDLLKTVNKIVKVECNCVVESFINNKEGK